MNPLTRAEEQVMQQLWKLKEGLLRDVVESMPEPKPHQNTVATILKILAEKKYVGIEQISRVNRYYPLVKKSDYSRSRIRSIARKYFEGSFSNIVSAMVQDNSLSVEDLEMLVKQLKKEKK